MLLSKTVAFDLSYALLNARSYPELSWNNPPTPLVSLDSTGREHDF